MLDVVRDLLTKHGEGKLAQIGPYVYKDTDSEQGFVDYTADIERDACLQLGRCPKRAGVMSALESFIHIPQATAYKATPYFFWRSLDPTQFDDNKRLINNHWEPLVLPAETIVFADGILNLAAKEFKSWAQIGFRVFGPKIMMPYEEVLNAEQTPRFKEFVQTLETVLPDSGARAYFQTVMGGVLRPHVSSKKAIFIQGPSGARKSTVATAILCAPSGVGGYSIEEIDDLATNRFVQSSLIGKWANLSDDPDGKAEKWTGWFKRYTGSSIMRGEFKKVNARNYPTTAKLVICCNNLPRMGDGSDAIWPRLSVFRFERSGTLQSMFADDAADHTKLNAEHWCERETRASMLRWLLEGILANTTIPAIVKEWNQTACSEADAARSKLEDMYERGTDTDFIPTDDVRMVLDGAGIGIPPSQLAAYMVSLFGARTERRRTEVAPGTIVRLRGFKGVKRSE